MAHEVLGGAFGKEEASGREMSCTALANFFCGFALYLHFAQWLTVCSALVGLFLFSQGAVGRAGY